MSATFAVQPDRILKELGELWVTLGKPEGGEAGQGVLRACAMTLVVLADADEDPAEVGETLAMLMREHPSRAIVLRIGPKAELEARVLAQCWMPFGSRRQICCEQVEIATPEAELEELAGVVRAVAVADLPLMVWIRIPRLLGSAFSRIATRVILDSAAFPSALEGFTALGDAASRGLNIGDLAWTRITRWREAVAQIFENPSYAANVAGIEQLCVGYAGATVPAEAWYLAAWLRFCLNKAGGAPRVDLKATAGTPPGLAGVDLAGPGFAVSMGRGVGCAGAVRVNSLANRLVLDRPSNYAALREELSVTGADPVFEASLREAGRLAAERA